jgi:hypothetical protein
MPLAEAEPSFFYLIMAAACFRRAAVIGRSTARGALRDIGREYLNQGRSFCLEARVCHDLRASAVDHTAQSGLSRYFEEIRRFPLLEPYACRRAEARTVHVLCMADERMDGGSRCGGVASAGRRSAGKSGEQAWRRNSRACSATNYDSSLISPTSIKCAAMSEPLSPWR